MTEPSLDATALADLVRAGEVSPLELVEAAIARIDAGNEAINAVIHRRYEAARAEAAGDLPDGPFRGVPFLVKDLECVMAGEPHHQGNVALMRADHRSAHDSALARRFVSSGLVTLGRTNTPELGLTITTEPVAYGPTRNPWNLAHSAGGSSGGSAAAVAAGFVPLAHGNDGGGSIRIPASECGLVGLKPSRGRVSKAPDIGESWNGATVDGVLSRSVRDTATALDVIAGPEPGDPNVAPPPLRPYADEVGASPGQLRIGLATHVGDVTTHPECVAAVEAAGALLASLGHHVAMDQPAALWEDDFSTHFTTVVAASTAADVQVLGASIGRAFGPDDMEGDSWFLATIGEAITAPAYLASVSWLHRWQRRLAGWWAQGNDILVTPVIATPPPPIGWLRDREHGTARLMETTVFTAQFNVSGQPAISLPLHWTADGLPVGVQFVAPFGCEDMLLRLASQLEDAAPWAHRHPPLV